MNKQIAKCPFQEKRDYNFDYFIREENIASEAC